MIGDLSGRRLVVAGGASGIGLATARLAQAAGAAVAVIDRSAPPAGVEGFLADLRIASEVDLAMTAVSRTLSGLDMLVYSAGIDLRAPLAQMTDEDWQTVLDVNLTGAMRFCRLALPHFSADGGSITLVSSGAGLLPLHERSAYSVSKAGLNMLAKCLAMELAPRNIRVNALCPGAVETALFRSSLVAGAGEEAERQLVRDRYALQRIAEPEEIARSVLFLGSDAASYITGVALAADGGRTFH
ncbi:SDR family oxidoreductase [Acidisoma cellulosilytica]|uniref:SDR family oxidoreductase n=1 Tax=Acidisoma cellulosilyticum TaxID=2802395 RepID=A0A963Z6G8_9PROT|nr:SDR family oxidoreductase [Acidisoma cellulosilyticum]MCB8882728.1 SDR family oxidoreductase [Acidisoma cellulosilyticum]